MNFKHGHTVNKKRSSEHSVWTDMLKRCENKNHIFYFRYGGRGISVCPRWKEFKAFLQDMGKRPPGHSLERVNNDGNYSPENCVWASTKEQARNRSSTILIKLNGKEKPLIQWCEDKKLNYARVYARIYKLGWTPEEALGGGI